CGPWCARPGRLPSPRSFAGPQRCARTISASRARTSACASACTSITSRIARLDPLVHRSSRNFQMAKSSLFRIPLLVAVVGAALLQAACGGGGDGVGSGGTGFISGSVIKGPAANATVNAYAVANGQMGAALGSVTADGNGNFTLPIGSYSGPLMLQASAGTFRDEATGALMTMASGDVMTAALPSVASGATVSGIQVTPVTSMAQTRALQMTGGMTD